MFYLGLPGNVYLTVTKITRIAGEAAANSGDSQIVYLIYSFLEFQNKEYA